MLGHKSLGKSPQRSNALGIEYKSLLSIATVVQIHSRKHLVEVAIWNFGHVHVTEIENIDILFGMVRDSPEPQHHQHEIVYRIIILVNCQAVVEPISPDYHNGLHIAIVPVSVNAPSFQPTDGLLCQSGHDGVCLEFLYC